MCGRRQRVCFRAIQRLEGLWCADTILLSNSRELRHLLLHLAASGDDIRTRPAIHVCAKLKIMTTWASLTHSRLRDEKNAAALQILPIFRVAYSVGWCLPFYFFVWSLSKSISDIHNASPNGFRLTATSTWYTCNTLNWLVCLGTRSRNQGNFTACWS